MAVQPMHGGPRYRSGVMAAGTYGRVAVRKVTPVIGAEISGIDLSRPLDDATLAELEGALAENLVLFFRDQTLTGEQQLNFGRRFGTLQSHPLAPHEPGLDEMMIIRADEKSARVNGEEWHTDMSAEPQPPMGSILYMKVCPPVGGDTIFASMYAAWETLSDRMKQHPEGLTALHDGEFVYRGTYGHLGVKDRAAYSQSNHPVARTHPVTGRKALYVNRRFTTKINDLPKEESDALLAYLLQHLENPLFQCRLAWQEGTIAFWDNRCTQHRAMWDYWPHSRYANRVTILGETPQ